MDDQREDVKPTAALPPKTCPRCRLANPGTAERCDCGYDFVSKTVGRPSLYGGFPKTLKQLKIWVAIVVGLMAIQGLAYANAGRWLQFAVLAVFAAMVIWSYSRILQRKNWARIALALLTAPLGLLLLGDRDLRMYCLPRKDRQKGSWEG